jgi:hypothetical protein
MVLLNGVITHNVDLIPGIKYLKGYDGFAGD